MSFSIYPFQPNSTVSSFWPFDQCWDNSESMNNLLWRKGFEKTGTSCCPGRYFSWAIFLTVAKDPLLASQRNVFSFVLWSLLLPALAELGCAGILSKLQRWAQRQVGQHSLWWEPLSASVCWPCCSCWIFYFKQCWDIFLSRIAVTSCMAGSLQPEHYRKGFVAWQFSRSLQMQWTRTRHLDGMASI